MDGRTPALDPGPPGRRRRSRLPAAASLAAVVLLGLFAAGGLYLFGRPVPAPVGLDPTGRPPSPGASEPAASAALSPGPSGGDPGSIAPEAGLDGTWTVDPSIGSFDDFSGSFAGYRVQEVLVGIGAATAVGRTPGVTGSVVVARSTVTEASFEVDLRTLRSDSAARDDQLRRQGLETDRFPTATFVLTEPIELEVVPAIGDVVRVEATGDLTLHGVTRRVTLPLEARLEADGTITVTGSLQVDFADFGIEAPESFRVLSVDPRATVELQLHLRRR